ncbi:hypothetical protein BEN74_16415 [Acinetobacter sp. WCHAc010034]|nr:hypothetical protein BEN74_16415 [Acinetobacter sp. WCHAc010034]
MAPDAGGQPHLIGLAVGRNSAQRVLAYLQCSKPMFLHKKDGRKSRLYFLGGLRLRCRTAYCSG